jgi:acetyl-CoA C-acetyltransferase
MMNDVVIVSRARTPIGSFQGALSSMSAPQLGAHAIRAAIERSGILSSEIDEVIMGQVLSAGVGQAPARQASIDAGIPTSVPCTTVNKVCGSGLKAVMLARQSILLGEAKIVVAGGMESMTNAPYLLPTARSGMRMGNQTAVDSMIHDGLWDPYGKAHMGAFGDSCAAHFHFSRQDQDQYAQRSYERAIAAQQAGCFIDEIVAVNGISEDEEPKRYRPEKMTSLRPAFGKEGTVTAANASKINDGASALVIMSGDEARRRNIAPSAKIVSTATFAQDPAWFTTAPVGAIRTALSLANLQVNDIDVFEINEAFAVAAMAVSHELKLNLERVNMWGGAVSLGHPIGASGARILTTLVSIMMKNNLKTGCAALCLGGGEAVAVVVQR